jgi:hypothetical protein
MFGKQLGSLVLAAVVIVGALAADDCGEPDPPPAGCTHGEQRQVVSPEGIGGFEVCINGTWIFYPAQ